MSNCFVCWMCWKWVQKSFPFNVSKAYLKYCLLVVSDILGTSQINFLITYFLQAKLLFLIYRYAFSIIDKCQAKKNGRLIMMKFLDDHVDDDDDNYTMKIFSFWATSYLSFEIEILFNFCFHKDTNSKMQLWCW